MLQRADVIGIEMHGLSITTFALIDLGLKARRLIVRIVEFGKTIGQFAARDKKLKPIGDKRIRVIAARQWRHFGGVCGDEYRAL